MVFCNMFLLSKVAFQRTVPQELKIPFSTDVKNKFQLSLSRLSRKIFLILAGDGPPPRKRCRQQWQHYLEEKFWHLCLVFSPFFHLPEKKCLFIISTGNLVDKNSLRSLEQHGILSIYQVHGGPKIFSNCRWILEALLGIPKHVFMHRNSKFMSHTKNQIKAPKTKRVNFEIGK